MKLLKDFKTSLFLSFRQVKNANLWVNLLIIFIMTVTFLNLVFISGILDGIVTGASNDLRDHYSGDLIITPMENRENITQTFRLQDELDEYPKIKEKSIRRITGAQIEKEKEKEKPNVTPNEISATLAGIDFEKENSVTQLDKFLVEGSYPTDERNQILIGGGYLSEYESALDESSLDDVSIGDNVKVKYGNRSNEYEVAGILEAKFNEVNSRVFIDSREFKTLTGTSRHLSDEIAMNVEDPTDENLEKLKSDLSSIVASSDSEVETWRESQGQFFDDLSTTFQLLGGVIGGIGITVASITLFIVIFINAIARERYIGIMKAIGIRSGIIKVSYILQSIFYAVIGSVIGFSILWFVMVPYFKDNPIDFPFSDGILDVTPQGIAIRIVVLVLSAIAAGLIPAHLIVKKNTIDSLLGR